MWLTTELCLTLGLKRKKVYCCKMEGATQIYLTQISSGIQVELRSHGLLDLISSTMIDYFMITRIVGMTVGWSLTGLL